MTEPSGDDEQLELDLGLSDGQKLTSELAALRAANATKMSTLAAQGHRPDPYGIVMTRLNALIDLALGSEEKLIFEVTFERLMVGVLGECLTQSGQIQLTQGVLGPPQPPNGNGSSGKLILP